MNRIVKGLLVGGAVLLCILLVGLIGFRLFWVTFVDNYELAFCYDKTTGKIEKIDRTGWIVRTPFWYSVHHVDLRPQQVSINVTFGSHNSVMASSATANSRILNAKLVQFNPAGLDTFVQWHGRDAGDDVYELRDILKVYAFDRDGGKDCPFLTVLNEVSTTQSPTPTKKETNP